MSFIREPLLDNRFVAFGCILEVDEIWVWTWDDCGRLTSADFGCRHVIGCKLCEGRVAEHLENTG
jgi:hypothetical protein